MQKPFLPSWIGVLHHHPSYNVQFARSHFPPLAFISPSLPARIRHIAGDLKPDNRLPARVSTETPYPLARRDSAPSPLRQTTSEAMALKQKGGQISTTDAKKRRRVGFTTIDSGVEANDCIKVFLVTSCIEVGNTSSFEAKPVDLNQFFGEEGKIYGYKNLKINVWFSLVTFHAYAEISFESSSDGGKGITDLKSALQDIFGESLMEKEEFLQTFSADCNYIRDIALKGASIPCHSLEKEGTPKTNTDSGLSLVEVLRLELNSMSVGLLYSRLVPLVLLYVDGGSPIDVTDPNWDMFLVVRKTENNSGDYSVCLLGFATVYRFFHYPDSQRLRIGQILVFPPYRGQGHGCLLLESVNFVAETENAYDVTAEEPSDYLQYLRACVDTHRLLDFEPIKPAINTVISCFKEGNQSKRISKLHCRPPVSMTEIARQKLKINKKEFLKCWEVLIYLKLHSEDQNCMETYKACVLDRVKSDMLDKDYEDNGKRLIEVANDYDHEMTFVVMRMQASNGPGSDGPLEGDKATQQEQLRELAEKQWESIVKIAKRVSSFRGGKI